MLKGHDFGPDLNMNALGIFYICFMVIWSLIIAAGLVALWIFRNNVAIRIRRFDLLATSIIVIHIYLCHVLVVYPMNGAFVCGLEFWVMSTLLPFGIALFQASNIQLLSLYEQQDYLANALYLGEKKRRFKFSPRGLLLYWRQLSTIKKTTLAIVVGLLAQICLTLFLYFGSRLFHASYGIFGKPQRDHFDCRRGYEWLPSVFWQFAWAYFFGPYVLYRIRHIRDVHYWALQTKLAIIAALPGTPLWIAFLYSTSEAASAVNKYFVAAGWFLPGLMTMQAVSIIIPLYDAYKNKAVTKRASSIYSTSSTRSRDIYSMAALETQIQKNVEPLLRWASQKDFTAENVVFLKAVRDFKKRWELAAKKSELSPLQLRERFEEAALIYFTLVNPISAKFNINIDFRIFAELEEMFRGLVYEPYVDDVSTTSSSNRTENIVTPWMDVIRPGQSTSRERLVSDIERLYPAPVTEIEMMPGRDHKIPSSFAIDVFDKAFDSVKYLVYTNTWVKFVDASETASIAESDITSYEFVDVAPSKK